MDWLDKVLAFRLRLGRIAGIDIHLHWSLLAVVLYILFTNIEFPQYAVVFVLALFGSVFLHELGHCWGARYVGGDATEVLMWPLGGLASLQVPNRPWPQFFSTATGPAVNLLLALLFLPPFLLAGGELGFLLPTRPGYGLSLVAGGTLAASLYVVISVNLFLLLFNVLPAYPMDGGRLLHTALWPRMGFARALKVAVYAAFVTAAGMILYSIAVRDMLLACIAIMVISGAWRELVKLRYGVYDAEADAEPWAASLRYEEEPERRPGPIARWLAARRARRDAADRERRADLRRRMDEVLAKVSASGLDSLTKEERRFLDHASEELRKEHGSRNP